MKERNKRIWKKRRRKNPLCLFVELSGFCVNVVKSDPFLCLSWASWEVVRWNPMGVNVSDWPRAMFQKHGREEAQVVQQAEPP